MPKLTLSKCEDLVWSVWESYDHDGVDDGLPEWGSYATLDLIRGKGKEGQEKAKEREKELHDQVVKYVQSKVKVTTDEVESLLNNVYHMRECVHYDERELSIEVKDWAKSLRDAQGKKEVGKDKIDCLRGIVNVMVSTYDPRWDPNNRPKKGRQYTQEEFQNEIVPLMDEEKEWEKKQTDDLVQMGIPRKECHVLLHYGRISKLDEKYKDERNEVYEEILKKNAKYLK